MEYLRFECRVYSKLKLRQDILREGDNNSQLKFIDEEEKVQEEEGQAQTQKHDDLNLV